MGFISHRKLVLTDLVSVSLSGISLYLILHDCTGARQYLLLCTWMILNLVLLVVCLYFHFLIMHWTKILGDK